MISIFRFYLCQVLLSLLLGFFIFNSTAYCEKGQDKKDPDAEKTYKNIKKNSKEEKEIIDKYLIPIPHQKVQKNQEKQENQPKKDSNDQSLKPTKHDKTKNLIKDKNKLENINTKNPWNNRIKYNLKADASKITIKILDNTNIFLKEFVVNAGEHGTKKGSNEAILWDGQDASGKELAAGEYKVFMTIEYEEKNKKDKEMEIKVFNINK